MNTEHILELHSQESQLREYWITLCREEKIEDNRHQRNVMYRHAFLVAAREHSSLGITAIAKITGKHHATLIHAQGNHDSNLRFNKIYFRAFQRISSNLSDILMSDIDFGEYNGLKDENKELRIRLMKLARKNRELILRKSIHEEEVRKIEEECNKLTLLNLDKDKRIQMLNKKISSIAW